MSQGDTFSEQDSQGDLDQLYSAPPSNGQSEVQTLQFQLASTMNELEIERKRNMKLHTIRHSLQLDLKRAKEIGFSLKAEADRERERAMRAEKICDDLRSQLSVVGGATAVQKRTMEMQEHHQAKQIATMLQNQLAESEQRRFLLVMQIQGLQSQLGVSSSASVDMTTECEEMQDEISMLRDSKRKIEMKILQLKEDLDLKSQELRISQRETKNTQRRLEKVSEELRHRNMELSRALSQLDCISRQGPTLFIERGGITPEPSSPAMNITTNSLSPTYPPKRNSIKRNKASNRRRKVVPRTKGIHGVAVLNTFIFFGAICMLVLYSHAKSLRSLQEKTDPPAYLISAKDTSSGAFVTTTGDNTGTGIPVGDKHNYPYGAECLNVNNIILAGREKAARKSGMITYKQGWNEEIFCHEATNHEELVVSQNADKWHESCEKIFGEICRRQCYTIAALFDRIDFTRYPPNSIEGGADYYLREKDCINCLVSDVCDQPPRTTFSARINRPLYGNRNGQDVLLPRDRILVTSQTQRNEPYGK